MESLMTYYKGLVKKYFPEELSWWDTYGWFVSVSPSAGLTTGAASVGAT
jgi:hypothetical protein